MYGDVNFVDVVVVLFFRSNLRAGAGASLLFTSLGASILRHADRTASYTYISILLQ